MFKYFEVMFLTFVLGQIKANAKHIQEILAPYIAQGETDIVALAYKVSPFLGAVVAEAVKALGAQLPKYEGDAVAWLEATISAWIKQLGG